MVQSKTIASATVYIQDAAWLECEKRRRQANLNVVR